METRAEKLAPGITLVPDYSWTADGGLKPPLVEQSRLDARLRRVVALMEGGDWRQVRWRTGIRNETAADQESVQYLPLLVRLNKKPISVDLLQEQLAQFNLEVAPAYFNDGTPEYFTARIALEERNPINVRDKKIHILNGEEILITTLQQQVAVILNAVYPDDSYLFASLNLPAPVVPCLEDSLRGMGLETDRQKPNYRKCANSPHPGKGRGVIIGIIDDGCAFAHPNFLMLSGGAAAPKSRILYLWDQARDKAKATGGWTEPKDVATGKVDFKYGMELTDTEINKAIAANWTPAAVDEDGVYASVGYSVGDDIDLATHGTHVMDIAAGNGGSLMGAEGVAPEANIIFVQLKPKDIDFGMEALETDIADGVKYIFARAKERAAPHDYIPVVVNISYGGYGGPHNGSGIVEKYIDEELDNVVAGNAPAKKPGNRAVVVAAGNGFEADCHAHAIVRARAANPTKWRWIIKAEDPTPNSLEIFYNKDAKLDFYVTAPAGAAQQGPIHFGDFILDAGGKDVGQVTHNEVVNNLIKFEVLLNQTTVEDATGMNRNPAPAGIWMIEPRHRGGNAANVHAYIERDNSGVPGGARRRQSRFDPRDSRPDYTVAGFATGERSVSVGAYNTGSSEVCRYSACGPTLDGRKKPEICAPGEEDGLGRGILSASSRRAQPTRMNGTSASAPHVTGLIALMLEYAVSLGKELSWQDIQNMVKLGATNKAGLLQNRHNDVDDTRLVKQRDVWNDLIGAGMANVCETLKNIK